MVAVIGKEFRLKRRVFILTRKENELDIHANYKEPHGYWKQKGVFFLVICQF